MPKNIITETESSLESLLDELYPDEAIKAREDQEFSQLEEWEAEDQLAYARGDMTPEDLAIAY